MDTTNNRFADATTIEQVIGEAVGAGSYCWTDMQHTGLFLSKEASDIVDDAVARIFELAGLRFEAPERVTVTHRERPVDQRMADRQTRLDALDRALTTFDSDDITASDIVVRAEVFLTFITGSNR